MKKYLEIAIEKYRNAVIQNWHIVGDEENVEYLKTLPIEDLLMQAVTMARVNIEIDTREYKRLEKEN